MATLFTRIITGELPGIFVWKDEVCVAFLSIHPIRPGHVLVVPRAEVDHWILLEPAVNAHLLRVAQQVGKAQQSIYRPEKIGLMVAGLEVPHVHYHVLPIRDAGDLDFARADTRATREALLQEAAAIRAELRAQGAAHVAD